MDFDGNFQSMSYSYKTPIISIEEEFIFEKNHQGFCKKSLSGNK